MVVGVPWCPPGAGLGDGNLASVTAMPERERERETERATEREREGSGGVGVWALPCALPQAWGWERRAGLSPGRAFWERRERERESAHRERSAQPECGH